MVVNDKLEPCYTSSKFLSDNKNVKHASTSCPTVMMPVEALEHEDVC
jgi:hypothetical protein